MRDNETAHRIVFSYDFAVFGGLAHAAPGSSWQNAPLRLLPFEKFNAAAAPLLWRLNAKPGHIGLAPSSPLSAEEINGKQYDRTRRSAPQVGAASTEDGYGDDRTEAPVGHPFARQLLGRHRCAAAAGR